MELMEFSVESEEAAPEVEGNPDADAYSLGYLPLQVAATPTRCGGGRSLMHVCCYPLLGFQSGAFLGRLKRFKPQPPP